MTSKISFGKTFQLLKNAMSVAHRRHSLIISNISNIDTPGYKGRDIDFKSAMAEAIKVDKNVRLAKTNSGHMGINSGSLPNVEVFEEKSEWNGFNYMSSVQQITKLTENNLVYRTATEILLRKIAIMKEIIREGGR